MVCATEVCIEVNLCIASTVEGHGGETRRLPAEPGRALGETVFAPRPNGRGEDDGWLLLQGYDARRNENYVEIRDASTGDVERSFDAGSVTVMNVVFSPDGSLLATSGEDAAIRVFDLDAETGVQQLVLRGHDLLVSGLDFSPDGKRLVSASPDGVVRVWALDLDELIQIAERELTRGLTDDECRQYRIDPCD